MNKKQRERMAALSCDLVKLPLGGAVLYPIFQENMIAAIVFFGLATSLALVYLAVLLESDHD
ncbi:hypothetical protein [uncultured Endozoicomonas sp.]|uniref:hypothetical protein n=1 Tax=uncultured Endozoicomonas sp. TaxID=432652 RepID=UPI0026378FC6|nr:hypothetical protein [uncultured Endozoicomonas sp.]